MGKSAIGIDIGTGRLKLALCDGGIIRRVVSETLPDHLVREGRVVSYEAMADFIRETMKKCRLYGKECAVVLPTGAAYLRRVSLPAMSVEQLAVNLPYEFRDYLTMGKDHYFYDYAVNELRRDESGALREMDLLAAAVSKELIGAYREMFRRAGLRMKVAAPVECAYANLLRTYGAAHPETAGAERCILDLGHAATRVHIFTGARFEATRVIEYGGGMVDSAIAESLGVDEHVARTYKEADHGGAQVLDGPKSIYANIAVEIMKAINFYGFSNRESDLKDAYLTGGGGEIAALRETVSKSLELNIHQIAELMPAGTEGEERAPFAAAVGIALQ